jgi:putative DNA primase/helicase
MCTTVAPVSGRCPVFIGFLGDITCGDRGLAIYLQQALGALLSGASEDHWLQFWYGTGRNGKSTLGEIVTRVMGDYAKKIPAQTLLHDRHGNRHPTEIANLAGVRLALSSEVSEGDFWDETRIKELTGDAMLSARYMRQDFFQFPRTHKHIIYGNHRPLLRVVDPAIAARLHVVPFNASFTAEQGNLDLQMGAKLWEEAGAILQWLIDGHAAWRDTGKLRPCAAVEAATKDYFESQSTLDMWVTECCEFVPNDERPLILLHRASELYTNYKAWKEERGEHPLSTTRWGEQMRRRFDRVTTNVGFRYRGLKLKNSVV